MREYATHVSSAESLDEVSWLALAQRIRVPEQMLGQLVGSMDSGVKAAFWAEVLKARIEQAMHAGIFQQARCERVEGKALNMLETLLDKGMIRNTGELMAVAKGAPRLTQPQPNQGNTNVTLNVGGFDMRIGNESGQLPAGGETIKIDLSPRLANTLAQPPEQRDERVIDSHMLSADELRRVGTEPARATELDAQELDSFFGNTKETD